MIVERVLLLVDEGSHRWVIFASGIEVFKERLVVKIQQVTCLHSYTKWWVKCPCTTYLSPSFLKLFQIFYDVWIQQTTLISLDFILKAIF